MWKGIERVRPGAYLGDIGQRSRPSPRTTASRWCASSAATASASASTKSRRCCTTASRARSTRGAGHDVHDRADDQRRQARHPRGRRRLDHRHTGPLAVGAVGAHRARHRERLRGADAVGGRPAAAGVRRRLRAGKREPSRSDRRRPEARRAVVSSSTASHNCAAPRAARRFATEGGAARALPGGAAEARGGAHASVRALPRLVDATLRELWRDAAMPAGAALVAVGGYGRGELFPHSDVDVLVLLPTATTAAAARGAATSASSPPAGTSASRSARACARSTSASEARERRDRADGAARSAPPVRRARGVQGLRARHRAGDGPEGVSARQDAREAPAPPEVPGHALLARAELQGKPGRPARPADGDLGRARGRPRQQVAGARRATA